MQIRFYQLPLQGPRPLVLLSRDLIKYTRDEDAFDRDDLAQFGRVHEFYSHVTSRRFLLSRNFRDILVPVRG